MKIKEKLHLDAQMQMMQMKHYYEWSLSFLKNNIGKFVWDSSAGIGILTDILQQKNVGSLFLTEFSDENLKILNQKYQNTSNITVEFCDLTKVKSENLSDKKIDTIINLDVLEHLPDDDAILKLFYETLTPGGHLLLKTPAHQLLFCEIDKASHHFRRYSKKELKTKIKRAGFKIKTISYMNMPGAVLYFIKGKILKKTTNFSTTISHKNIRLMNKLIPLIRIFEKIFPVFFGLSVILVAQKE